MPTNTILGYEYINSSANVQNPYVRSNEADDANTHATQRVATFNISSGSTISITSTLYNNNNYFQLTGTPSNNVTLRIPQGDRFFALENQTNKEVIINTVSSSTSTGSSAKPSLYPNEISAYQLYNTVVNSIDGNRNYYGVFRQGSYIANEELFRVKPVKTITTPIDLQGSVGNVGTNPTSQRVFSLEKNSTQFATVTVSTSGVVTFSTSSEITFTKNSDVLSLVAPASADATLSDLSIIIFNTIS